MKNVVYSAMFDADAYPFHTLGKRVQVVKQPDELNDFNSVLVIWGGADISPSLYNHPKSRTTYTSEHRDSVEWRLAHDAVAKGIPIIGVCRGAQMLCALAGGYLIQDTTGHATHHGHDVTTNDGKRFAVNSLHHQMMAGLESVEHELIGWSTNRLSRYYTYKNDLEYLPTKDFKEPELVWFPTIRGLACQWHPEMLDEECESTKYLLEKFHAYN